jgi:hypothetical protein
MCIDIFWHQHPQAKFLATLLQLIKMVPARKEISPHERKYYIIDWLNFDTNHGLAEQEQHPSIEGTGQVCKVHSNAQVVDGRSIVLLVCRHCLQIKTNDWKALNEQPLCSDGTGLQFKESRLNWAAPNVFEERPIKWIWLVLRAQKSLRPGFNAQPEPEKNWLFPSPPYWAFNSFEAHYPRGQQRANIQKFKQFVMLLIEIIKTLHWIS